MVVFIRVYDNTVPITYPDSPSIVPLIFDLYLSLIDKFKRFNDNVEIYLNRNSVQDIPHLLHDYHEEDSIFYIRVKQYVSLSI